MINLTEKAPDLIAMEIKMHLPQPHVIRFLQSKGYDIKAFTKIYEPTEQMLTSEPGFTYHTFTATKPGEEQSFKNHYLKVFEKEINEFLIGFKRL